MGGQGERGLSHSRARKLVSSGHARSLTTSGGSGPSRVVQEADPQGPPRPTREVTRGCRALTLKDGSEPSRSSSPRACGVCGLGHRRNHPAALVPTPGPLSRSTPLEIESQIREEEPKSLTLL